MPEENVELIRRWFDAWNRAELDAFISIFDPDAEVFTDPSWLEPGPFRGRAAIGEWFEGLREAWGKRNRVVLREVVEVGSTVVARIDWQVQGRSSGLATDLDATSVSAFEGRKIVRQQWYFDHEEALAAAEALR